MTRSEMETLVGKLSLEELYDLTEECLRYVEADVSIPMFLDSLNLAGFRKLRAALRERGAEG